MTSYDTRTSLNGGQSRYNSRRNNTQEFEESEELKNLRRLYSDKLPTLRELFNDWKDEDLLFVLQEANGDLEITIHRITEGHTSQWDEVKTKKDRKRDSAQTGRGSTSNRGSFQGRDGQPANSGGRGGYSGQRGRARNANAGGPPRNNQYRSQNGSNSSYQRPPRHGGGEVKSSATDSDAGWGNDASNSWGNDSNEKATSGWDTNEKATSGWDTNEKAASTWDANEAPSASWGGDPSPTWDQTGTSGWSEATENKKKPAETVVKNDKPVINNKSTTPAGTTAQPTTWANLLKNNSPQPVVEPKSTVPQTQVTSEPTFEEVKEPESNPWTSSEPEPTTIESFIEPEPTLASPEPAEILQAVRTPSPKVESLTIDISPAPSSATLAPVIAASTPITTPTSSVVLPSQNIKDTAPPGLSKQRNPSTRRLKQDTPVVMPGMGGNVERMTLQFGSLGMPSSDVDVEKEKEVTITKPVEEKPILSPAPPTAPVATSTPEVQPLSASASVPATTTALQQQVSAQQPGQQQPTIQPGLNRLSTVVTAATTGSTNSPTSLSGFQQPQQSMSFQQPQATVPSSSTPTAFNSTVQPNLSYAKQHELLALQQAQQQQQQQQQQQHFDPIAYTSNYLASQGAGGLSFAGLPTMATLPLGGDYGLYGTDAQRAPIQYYDPTVYGQNPAGLPRDKFSQDNASQGSTASTPSTAAQVQQSAQQQQSQPQQAAYNLAAGVPYYPYYYVPNPSQFPSYQQSGFGQPFVGKNMYPMYTTHHQSTKPGVGGVAGAAAYGTSSPYGGQHLGQYSQASQPNYVDDMIHHGQGIPAMGGMGVMSTGTGLDYSGQKYGANPLNFLANTGSTQGQPTTGPSANNKNTSNPSDQLPQYNKYGSSEKISSTGQPQQGTNSNPTTPGGPQGTGTVSSAYYGQPQFSNYQYQYPQQGGHQGHHGGQGHHGRGGQYWNQP